MKLHLQKTAHDWAIVEIGPCALNRKTPLLKQIDHILVRERDHKSKRRILSGFCVSLSPEEERKLRKSLEPICGSLDDQNFVYVLSRILQSQSAIFSVHAKSPGRRKKKSSPSFSFWLR
ncbi:MAG TPA: hypothetical protein VEC13_01715 [Candidatus Paceibacterota bacterium]|nr:hypothetical protein [Candidatus Paceibacterota bacterium]